MVLCLIQGAVPIPPTGGCWPLRRDEYRSHTSVGWSIPFVSFVSSFSFLQKKPLTCHYLGDVDYCDTMSTGPTLKWNEASFLSSFFRFEACNDIMFHTTWRVCMLITEARWRNCVYLILKLSPVIGQTLSFPVPKKNYTTFHCENSISQSILRPWLG